MTLPSGATFTTSVTADLDGSELSNGNSWVIDVNGGRNSAITIKSPQLRAERAPDYFKIGKKE